MEIEFLKKKNLVSNIWEFRFSRPAGFAYDAGDYIEMGISNVGSHWLSMSSHPSEKELIFTLKFREQLSLFKSALNKLNSGDKVYTSPAIGNFNLPRQTGKLLFIALGIGITPYRSLLIDFDNAKHGTVLAYAAKDGEHIYEDIIEKSGVTYQKYTSRVDVDAIAQNVTDYKDRIIYLSGPQNACMELYGQLVNTGVDRHQIKLEYFPGYTKI